MTLAAWGVLVLIASAGAAADRDQSSAAPRDVRTVARGTSTISGVVVADDNDAKPVRHARVMLKGAEAAGATTVTDDRGRFAFTGLPAGRFELTASKDGWITAAYGAKRPLRPGTALPLAEGRAVDVTIRLLHGAAISGALLDNAGQPSVGTMVRAMRYAIVDGERRLTPSRASATTDDRGIYRIYGLPPGDYVVGAAWRPGYFGMKGDELRLTTDVDVRHAAAPGPPAPPPPDRTVALASTFYPGTTVPSQATTITVRGGEERDGIDFTLQVVPTARVDGTISLPGNVMNPAGLQVSLMATGQVLLPGISFDAYRTTVADADGHFVFGDVAPGQYTVLARASVPNPTGGSQAVWASADVSIDGDPIEGLPLALGPGMTLSGGVRFESAASKPHVDVQGVRVSLQPVQSGDAATIVPAPASVDAAGRFTISGIAPGRYRLTATGPNRWSLRSAIVNGVDTLDVPLVVQPNQNVAGALITFVDRPAQLSGRLVDVAGSPTSGYSIVLFPEDQALWIPRARRIQCVRPAADGAFSFNGLPPGTYQLGAVEDVEPGEWYDPAFLRQFVAASMKVTIAEGEQRIQNVRLGR